MPSSAGFFDEPRECVRKHGQMDRVPGLWEVSEFGQNDYRTGTVFVVALYRCPICGFVELVDEEVSDGAA